MPSKKLYIFSGGICDSASGGVITLYAITVTDERLKMAAQTCIICNQESQEGCTWVKMGKIW